MSATESAGHNKTKTKSGRGQPHSKTCRIIATPAKRREVLECGCAETVSKLIFAPPKDPTRVIKTRHNSNGSEKFSRRTFFETFETVSGQPHSKTYRIYNGQPTARSVLECGCPLPLSQRLTEPQLGVRGLLTTVIWDLGFLIGCCQAFPGTDSSVNCQAIAPARATDLVQADLYAHGGFRVGMASRQPDRA